MADSLVTQLAARLLLLAVVVLSFIYWQYLRVLARSQFSMAWRWTIQASARKPWLPGWQVAIGTFCSCVGIPISGIGIWYLWRPGSALFSLASSASRMRSLVSLPCVGRPRNWVPAVLALIGAPHLGAF